MTNRNLKLTSAFLLATLLLFSPVLAQTEEELLDEGLAGGWSDVKDSNSLSVEQQRALDFALRSLSKGTDGQSSNNLEVVKLFKVKSQVVAGMNYQFFALVVNENQERNLLDAIVYSKLGQYDQNDPDALLELTYGALIKDAATLEQVTNETRLKLIGDAINEIHNPKHGRSKAKYRVKKWLSMRGIAHEKGQYYIADYVIEGTNNRVARYESVLRIEKHYLDTFEEPKTYMLDNLLTVELPLNESTKYVEAAQDQNLQGAQCSEIKNYITCLLKTQCDGQGFLKSGSCQSVDSQNPDEFL